MMVTCRGVDPDSIDMESVVDYILKVLKIPLSAMPDNRQKCLITAHYMAEPPRCSFNRPIICCAFTNLGRTSSKFNLLAIIA